jgi:hypothetical protein
MRKLLAIALLILSCTSCAKVLHLGGEAPDSSDEVILAQALKYKYKDGGHTVVIPTTKLSFPFAEPKDVSTIKEFAKTTLNVSIFGCGDI